MSTENEGFSHNNPTEAEEEFIGRNGAALINATRQKYPLWKIKAIQDKWEVKQKVKFWEKGYNIGIKPFVFLMFFCSLIGWGFSGSLYAFYQRASGFLRISTGASVAMLFALIVCATYNLYHIGRIYMFFGSTYNPPRIEVEEFKLAGEQATDDDLVGQVKGLLKGAKARLSATEIVEALGLNMTANELGTFLANYKHIFNFSRNTQKRSYGLTSEEPKVKKEDEAAAKNK